MKGVLPSVVLCAAFFLPFCSSFGYVSWRAVYELPDEPLLTAETVNWVPVVQVANDALFDVKVQAGLVPAPASS